MFNINLPEWINSIFKFFRENWKLIIGIILILLFLAMGAAIYWLYSENEFNKAESKRHEKNSQIYFEKASERVQTFTVTPNEAKNNATIDSLKTAYATLVDTKPKFITKIHEIKGETIYRDTGRIEIIMIGQDVFQSIPIKDKCFTGMAYWQAGEDTAMVSVENKIDLGIIGYQVRPKNWFINFKWNPRKWETEAIIINNCDTNMKWTKNLSIEIKK